MSKQKMSEMFKKLRKLLNADDGYGQYAVREPFFHGEAEDNGFEDSVKISGYSYKLLERYGGEGYGEDYWAVYEFTSLETQEKCVIKFDGWYASYVGSEFTEMREVKPVQKTITVFE